MKYRPLIGDGMSGSVGGITASHNRGGVYFRQRATPVNPNTTFQQEVRSLFGNLQSAWGSILTDAQRSAWDAYALATPITDALGQSVNVGGKGMFTRGNTPRLQAGLLRIDAGPVVSGLPSLTAPGVTSITAGTGIAIVTFDNTDAWANEDGGALLVFMSRPQSATINGFKGPYRFAGAVLGDDSVAPTSPVNITSPFTLGVGQKVFFRFAAVTADGRLTPDVRTFSVSI